ESGLLMSLAEGDRTETAFSYALDVFRLRGAILEPDADPDGLERVLESAGRELVGGLASALDDLADRGYDHLCVVPHGPLQFVPFHLLRGDGPSLADRWTVTML